MFSFTFGGIGSGKSLVQANQVIKALKRSVFIEKKYKLPVRKILCNFHIDKVIAEKWKDRIIVWHNPLDMIFEDYPECKIIRKNFDCFWDELAVELASDKWKDTHAEIRRFFAQHRKRGIEIYGNTQDYRMLDINARRMATEIHSTQKACGSRDISATLPPVKHVWGLILIWSIDKNSVEVDGEVKKNFWIPRLMLITKDLTDFYDTTEDINPAGYEDLKHIEKKCRICGAVKITHQ